MQTGRTHAPTTRNTHAAQHRAQEQRQQTQLLADEGGSVRAGVVARRLGVPVLMIDQLRQSGRVLAAPLDRGYVYPTWQFEGRGFLSGLSPVLEVLAGCDAWAQIGFFLTSAPELGGQRPLDVLRRGEFEQVQQAARRFVTAELR